MIIKMGRYLTFLHLAGYHRNIRKQFSVTILFAMFTLYLYFISLDTKHISVVPRQLPLITNVDLTVIRTQINISNRELISKAESRANDSRYHKKVEMKASQTSDGKHDLDSEYWGCVNEKVRVGIESYSEVTLTQERLCSGPATTTSRHHGITLFTTMHEKNASLLFIFNNTLHMWAQLRPFVRPVLFMAWSYRNGPLVREACRLGWDVYALPLCNEEDYPVLKAMFQVAQTVWDSTWYGYANGDVLFSSHLASALTFMEQHKNVSQHSLITGRRKDIHLYPNEQIRTAEDLEVFSDNGKMHGPYGLDYFITHKDGFRWTDILPFVVGATRFDNWLLWYAIRQKDVYDVKATRAIVPLHQQIGEGSAIPHTDDFNKLLIADSLEHISEGFKVTYGNTGCMHNILEPTSGPEGYRIYSRRSKPEYCDEFS